MSGSSSFASHTIIGKSANVIKRDVIHNPRKLLTDEERARQSSIASSAGSTSVDEYSSVERSPFNDRVTSQRGSVESTSTEEAEVIQKKQKDIKTVKNKKQHRAAKKSFNANATKERKTKEARVGTGPENKPATSSEPVPEYHTINNSEARRSKIVRSLIFDDSVYEPRFDEKFRDLAENKPGSDKFMAAFNTIVSHFFRKKPDEHHEYDNGKYSEHDVHENHSKVHLFKSTEGIGIKVPNITFENAHLFLNVDYSYEMFDSREHRFFRTPFRKLLKEYKKERRDVMYNILSLEVSDCQKLGPLVKIPSFVEANSLVLQLEIRLKKTLKKNITEQRDHPSDPQFGETRRRISQQLENMPRYEKFFLFSFAGSFTDLHVDLSASTVSYHVLSGIKLFWVAPPTDENLKLYRQFELGDTNVWANGREFLKRFTMLEIREGEVAMLPSGYLHFVYTPVDSVVTGGNYLTEQSLDLQFKMTRLEDECFDKNRHSNRNLFRYFWDIQFSYLEFVFLEDCKLLRQAEQRRLPDYMEKMAILLLHGLKEKSEKRTDLTWYTEQKQEELLQELENVLKSSHSRKRTSDERLYEDFSDESEEDEDF